MDGKNGFRIGCCISGHGFGHATRAIAVMQALSRRVAVTLTIVTQAPAWLFAESLCVPFDLHAEAVDVGLVQHSALVEDLPATLQALAAFSSQAEERVARIAGHLAGCHLVLCDIAPWGIAAAQQANIPSILIENFTWDWIYEGYADRWPQLGPHIDVLRALFHLADYHIQTRPVCAPTACDLVVDPVARALVRPEQVRQRLYLESGQKVVLLTMGGLGIEAVSLQPLLQRPDLVFVLPGKSRENEFTGNLRFLGREAAWYHPDLVAAVDLVVGKLGYSTVAEAYRAKTPFAYVTRRDFRESASLAAFVDEQLFSWKIPQECLSNGRWLEALPPFPAEQARIPRTMNGADQVAIWLADLLNEQPHAPS
jgi:UDP:flavonoid glycosyltransferase YjiC (YdhE family)